MNVLTDDPNIEGYKFVLLTVDDFLDKRRVEGLKQYNQKFETLTLEQCKAMIVLQSQILNQLGVYESIESDSPKLGYLVREKPDKVKTSTEKPRSLHPHAKNR